MVKFSVYPERTTLLIIDMQNGFLKPGSRLELPGGRELIPRLTRLMDACRNKGMPVIFTRHVYAKDGSDIGVSYEFFPELVLLAGTEDVEFYKEIEPREGDVIIEKRRYSAFYGTELDLVLRCRGIDTLIIGGLATNICCECTARDARIRDYKVIFLSDGTAPLSIPDTGWGAVSGGKVQRYVLASLAYRFAQVASVEEIIGQLSQTVLGHGR
jgi:ureidoacrylate peracid hydrolase